MYTNVLRLFNASALFIISMIWVIRDCFSLSGIFHHSRSYILHTKSWQWLQNWERAWQPPSALWGKQSHQSPTITDRGVEIDSGMTSRKFINFYNYVSKSAKILLIYVPFPPYRATTRCRGRRRGTWARRHTRRCRAAWWWTRPAGTRRSCSWSCRLRWTRAGRRRSRRRRSPPPSWRTTARAASETTPCLRTSGHIIMFLSLFVQSHNCTLIKNGILVEIFCLWPSSKILP